MQRKLPQSNLYLREEELRRGIELLYFAYRDFTRDPDAILAESGLAAPIIVFYTLSGEIRAQLYQDCLAC